MKKDVDRPLRVLIVNDALPIRWRLRDLIEETCRIDLVGEAASASSAMALFRRHDPDAVLLDLELNGGCDALSLLRRMKRKRPACVVIVLTSHAIEPYAKRCRELGADYFFDKFHQMDRVPEVLRAINRQ